MQSLFRLIVLFAIAVFLSLATSAWSNEPGLDFGSSPQETVPLPDWEKRQNIEQRLRTFGDGLMGDAVDPATRALVFSHTDIDVPGNFDLPVRIERKRGMGETYLARVDVDFGDWELVVPKISALTIGSGGWRNAGQRCSGEFLENFPRIASSSTYISPDDYHNGIHMEAPGAGSRLLLYTKDSRDRLPDNLSKIPQIPSTAKFVTTDNWYFTCIGASDGGQGLLGHGPNGDTYRFDRVISRQANDQRFTAGGRSGGNRYRVMLMATEVRDVNGNTVNYHYDSSDRLTHITASDERRINLSYSGLLISSATIADTGRSWNYTYRDTTFKDPDWLVTGGNLRRNKVLSTAVQPDQKSWTFGLDGMYATPKPNAQCADQNFTATITHPYGTVGRFVVKARAYRASETARRREWPECPDVLGELSGGNPNLNPLPSNHIAYIRTYGVTTKTLTVSGEDLTWIYTSGLNTGDRVNVTWIKSPDGSKLRYDHYWPRLSSDFHLGGKLKRTINFDASGQEMQKTEYEWIQENRLGSPSVSSALSPPNTYKILQTRATTFIDGDTYYSESDYITDFADSNYSYGFPIQTESYSNVSTAPRITDTTYEHNTSKWILGLPKTVTQNSRLMSSNDYDNLGQLDKQYRYGQEVAAFSYHSDGTIDTITDALGRMTKALSWKRGIPRTVYKAYGSSDEITLSRTVDNNGWIMSQTDAKGYRTAYARDNMGRLTQINPWGHWSNTDIGYDFSSGGAVQTIIRGQSKQTITYDSMFRPILERSQALDTGWSAHVNTRYDGLGRVTFKSQPSSSSIVTEGVDYKYDGLGRLEEERETVSGAVTQHYYETGHIYRVTDPEGYDTSYTSRGYDGPNNQDYSKIVNHGGQRETILHKNIWGEVNAVQQRGSHNGYHVNEFQHFFYDDQRRVCRSRTPQSADSIYQYDDANQLTAYMKGVTTSSNSCSMPTGPHKVSLVYDDLGRLEATTFADDFTPDIKRTYDNNNNVRTLTRSSSAGAVNWTYSYDNADHLKTETLTVDDESFGLTYYYNPNEHMNRKVLPSGQTIYYTPDGLGRSKTIKRGPDTLMNGAAYHPSGALSAMTYGNGMVFGQILNNRLLPERLQSYKPGGRTALDLSYTYDLRGKIRTMTDGMRADNSRTYSYDALGQLESSISGFWGTQTLTYDSLGNIRERLMTGSTRPRRNIRLSYDSQGRVFRSGDTKPIGSTDGTGIRTVAYDTRGNVTTLGTMGFVYDETNQPTVVTGSAPHGPQTNGNYYYDGNLKRVKSVIDGKTIYNVYDAAGSLVHVKEAAMNKVTEYVSGPNGALARLVNGVLTYVHADHLGSPREISTASGGLQGYAFYTPFGLGTPDFLSKDQGGFTGHIKDSKTGLNYMQARYYDPVLGRFLSVDPVTFMMTGDTRYFNRYAYAANDPVNLIDPDGQFFGLAGKAIKLAVKGGDVGATVAGAVTDTKTIFSKNATIGQRLGATASLATEVFSPVSARDAKAGAKLAKSKLSGKCCFVAGTLVETEYGLRPIEEIELGDRVLARNPETGVTALKSVTDLIRLNKRQIWEVSLSGNDGTSEFFETTDDHPWWIVDEFGNGSWKDTAELSVGMSVTTADNQTMIITKVVETGRIDATYNLTVADFETYFVGENRILVHNCSPKVITDGPDGPFTMATFKRTNSNPNLRKEWEANNPGKSWPKDPASGRNADVSHKVPLADGGPDHVSNIEPLARKPHTDHHKKNKDFSRWAKRRGK